MDKKNLLINVLVKSIQLFIASKPPKIWHDKRGRIHVKHFSKIELCALIGCTPTSLLRWMKGAKIGNYFEREMIRLDILPQNWKELTSDDTGLRTDIKPGE